MTNGKVLLGFSIYFVISGIFQSIVTYLYLEQFYYYIQDIAEYFDVYSYSELFRYMNISIYITFIVAIVLLLLGLRKLIKYRKGQKHV